MSVGVGVGVDVDVNIGGFMSPLGGSVHLKGC